MKFSLTITDMTAEDVYNIISAVEDDVQSLTGATAEDVVENLKSFVTIQPEQNPHEDITVSGQAQTLTLPEPAKPVDELDADGLPWDERIHSGNHEKTNKGVWRRRRGVQDAYFDQIVAELKGTPTPMPVAEPEVAVDEPTPVEPEPVTEPATPARDYAALMKQITALIVGGHTPLQYTNSLLERVNEEFGIQAKALPDIREDANIVEYIWTLLDQDGKGV